MSQALQTLGILLNVEGCNEMKEHILRCHTTYLTLRLEASLMLLRRMVECCGAIIVAPPKLYRHWASSCMWLRDDATVIDAFLRSRLSPPYGWGIPQCVRVRMLPPWKLTFLCPQKFPTLSMMGILPYIL